MCQLGFVLNVLSALKSRLFRVTEPLPDLGSQMEDLLIEVWAPGSIRAKASVHVRGHPTSLLSNWSCSCITARCRVAR